MSTIVTYLLSEEQKQKQAMVFAPGCHRFLYEAPDRKPMDNLVGWANIVEDDVWANTAHAAKDQHPFVLRFTFHSAFAKETAKTKLEEFRAALGEDVDAQVIHSDVDTDFADIFVIFLKS